MTLPASEYVDIALFALLIVTAIALVRNRDLLAVIVLGGIYSLLGAGLFLVMDAPDVAYTEAAVGVGIATVLMILAMSLVGREEAPAAHSRVLPLIVVLTTGATLMYGIYDVPPFGAPDSPVQEHVTPHYLNEQECSPRMVASRRGKKVADILPPRDTAPAEAAAEASAEATPE